MSDDAVAAMVIDAARSQSPAPPPPPPPPALPGVPEPVVAQGSQSEAAARMADELARAREEVGRITGQAAREQAGNLSVLRDGQGRTVVNTPDGRQIIIDPQAVPSLQAQEAIIRDALTLVPPPAPPEMPDRGPPESVLALIGMVMLFLTLMVIGFPLARAAGRRMDRKAQGGGMPGDVGQRLDRIEQAVEAVAVEMERVSEAQRFSARLLSERLPEALPQLDAAAQRARLQG